MAKARKSIPYYIVVICLGLMLGSLLLTFLWPIISTGLIVIRIQRTHVVFDAITFLVSVFLFLIFVGLLIKTTIDKQPNVIPRILGIVGGIAFIVSLSYQSIGWTSYPSLGKDLNPGFFDTVFMILYLITGVGICFMIYTWFKKGKR